MLELRTQESSLRLDPEQGGTVEAFSWRQQPVFRTGRESGDAIESSCFPLVPFAGRIAQGRFEHEGRAFTLPPNRADIDARNPLHGWGWLARWEVESSSLTKVRLVHEHAPGGNDEAGRWLWPYRAEQGFELSEDGYIHRLSITNLGATDMPAGLGLHPYFPRDNAAVSLRTCGVWHNDGSDIPDRFESGDFDILGGTYWDNTFAGLQSAIQIEWPCHVLTIEPDPTFTFTHVYCPQGADFFCIEPVSHMPDSVNRSDADYDTGRRTLAPGERWDTLTRVAMKEGVH